MGSTEGCFLMGLSGEAYCLGGSPAAQPGSTPPAVNLPFLPRADAEELKLFPLKTTKYMKTSLKQYEWMKHEQRDSWLFPCWRALGKTWSKGFINTFDWLMSSSMESTSLSSPRISTVFLKCLCFLIFIMHVDTMNMSVQWITGVKLDHNQSINTGIIYFWDYC